MPYIAGHLLLAAAILALGIFTVTASPQFLMRFERNGRELHSLVLERSGDLKRAMHVVRWSYRLIGGIVTLLGGFYLFVFTREAIRLLQGG